jgi:hypothetical protein
MGGIKEKTGPAPFLNLFVRYGAGAQVFTPLTKVKWWNAFAWISIVLGIAGWALFLYVVPPG